jgi:SanA protein
MIRKKIDKIIDFLISFLVRFYKIFRKSFLLFLLFIFSLIFFSNIIILFYSDEKIFYKTDNIPEKKVALVLGTSKYVVDNIGLINLFYKERISSANKLIESGKVKFLILSGTNDSEFYNEPENMKKDLMKMGVSEDKIFLDYAGFRTLDSILRTKEIFGQSDIIIVSQKFHLQRALTIARLNDIDAIGFAAKDPPFSLVFKTYFREIFSRINFLFDILLEKEAKFYGDKIEVK